MGRIEQKSTNRRNKNLYTLVFVLLLCVLAFWIYPFFLKHENTLYSHPFSVSLNDARQAPTTSEPFPVTVDPKRKIISENSFVDTYYTEHIAIRNGTDGARTSWVNKVLGKLALFELYQNLASLSSRTLIIQSGERREQVAENFGKILNWDRTEKQDFLNQIASATPEVREGKFFPSKYTVARNASIQEVATMVIDKFNSEISVRYSNEVSELVPLQDALVVASLLEREAYDFTDMRQISGVIWNRLFIDMPLQLDASLQYAKGSKSSESWWPLVRPADKYIESPYNTYKYEGLPPTAISNPSLDAILAALNPTKTDCMFYFHDKKGGFHCAPTYEEHVALLKQYYGRGK